MTQDQALAILKTGANVFLTGEPGSGKTFTVNEYVRYLRDVGIEPAITASTGIAATHIGGFTIHSWSGIGVRNFLSKYDLDSISQNKRVHDRVSKARILIIDEVSMLSAHMLSMVDDVCREIRGDGRPFGGLQVVLVGDFFQLPPISPRNKEKQEELSFQEETRVQFAYASPSWQGLSPLVCYLSEQHRQEDTAFLGLLTAIREQTFSPVHRALLRTRYSSTPTGLVAQLYSHNADVNRINDTELAKLSGSAHTFEMTSNGSEQFVAALKRGCLSPEELTLRIGARVMFTKNDPMMHKFVNGTMGSITGFVRSSGYPVVETLAGRTIFTEPMDWSMQEGGRVLARITQIPLRLAWAITVHKSQGMSLDAAHMDLSDTFEYGQGYVALSRVRTLKGLSLAGLNERALEVHPEVRKQDVQFREQSQCAEAAFLEILPAKLATMHENFIHACGGTREVRPLPRKKKAGSTYDKTKELVSRGLSLEEMATERGMTIGTILGHLEALVAKKRCDPKNDLAHLRPKEAYFAKMNTAFEVMFKKTGELKLSPARTIFEGDVSFEDLRLARLFFRT